MREVAQPFIDGVVAGAQKLRIGNPMSWDTEIGPLMSRDHCAAVAELVDDVVSAGARRLCAGRVESPAGFEHGADVGTLQGSQPVVASLRRNARPSRCGRRQPFCTGARLFGLAGFEPGLLRWPRSPPVWPETQSSAEAGQAVGRQQPLSYA
jgi:hypothetical protein